MRVVSECGSESVFEVKIVTEYSWTKETLPIKSVRLPNVARAGYESHDFVLVWCFFPVEIICILG